MKIAKIKENTNGWWYDLGWCSGIGSGSKEDAIKRAKEAEPGCKIKIYPLVPDGVKKAALMSASTTEFTI
jgi:hypothetical protein